MDEAKVKEFLKKLEDPNVSPIVKQTIRAGLEKAMHGGFQAAYEDQLRLRARTDLESFAKYIYGYEEIYPHQKEIIDALMDDSIKELLIIASPGSSKSTLVSQIFMPFYLANNPEHSCILVSSSSQQSVKFSSDIRSLISSNKRFHEVFPEIEIDALKGESREQIYLKRERQNPHPSLYAAGMRSTKVLGSRANLIVVDDPLTQTQARSELELKNQKEWFEGTLMTRLIPEKSKIVVVLTRWHNNDLGSLLLNKMNFRVIHMPALSEDPKGVYVDFLPPLFDKEIDVESLDLSEIDNDSPMDSFGDDIKSSYSARLERECSDLKDQGADVDIVFSSANKRDCIRKYIRNDGHRSIWPEQFSDKFFLSKQASLGTVQFRLLYQGDATGLSGDVFKREWFNYYGPGIDPHGNETTKKAIPEGSTYFISIDPALSTSKRADYFVAAVIARDKEGNYYVVEVVRTKIEAPDQVKLIQKLYQKYPQTIWVLVETVAFQLALFQNLIREGIPCRKYRPAPGRDKELRARSASAIFEAGKVWLPTNAHWRDVFEDEFTSFPRNTYDDQVDCVCSLLEEVGLMTARKSITYKVGFG